MTWTDERIDQLLELNKLGLSATQIADRMKGCISRGAVIGKLMRLNVPLKSARTPTGQPRGAARKPIERRVRVARPRLPVWKPPVEPLPSPQVDDIASIKLVDLEPHHCRFPVGDPQHADFGFCGKQHVEGTSYCAGHLHRCTVPVKPRSVRPAFEPRGLTPEMSLRTALRVLEPA